MIAVLYDFDGLLIDSESAGLISWREVYESFGHALDLEYWLAETLAGRGPCMPVDRLEELTGGPVDWETIEPRRLTRRNELLTARPGVISHLAMCARDDVRTGIVSNAPDWWITERLSAIGIAESAFDVVITKSPAIAKKPAPDAYAAALGALGIAPDSAIAFEDSPIGVAAAQAAGIRCVAIPNSVTENFDLSGADLVLPSIDARPLDEVLELLRIGR